MYDPDHYDNDHDDLAPATRLIEVIGAMLVIIMAIGLVAYFGIES